MNIHLTEREFRLLLDLVYTGNWVLNSTRENDRIHAYDVVTSLIFAHCEDVGLNSLVDNGMFPSGEYMDGGIHEAILDYEDSIFYGILAEEMARRDLRDRDVEGADSELLTEKIEEYMQEFSENGIENLQINRRDS